MRAIRLFGGLLPWNDAAGIFNDSAAFADDLPGVNALAVNLGPPDL
jgi:hypothetical protein